MAVRQIPVAPWPSRWFWCVAVLALEPAELAARHGLVFEALEEDGLGPAVRAAIALPDGSQCLLRRVEFNPSPGTEVNVDEAADHARARADVLRLLGLGPEAFAWVNPDDDA